MLSSYVAGPRWTGRTQWWGVLVISGTSPGSSVHDGPDAEPGGVGLIRARGEIQQLRYGERQEVGEQRRGLRRGLTSGVLLKRVSGAVPLASGATPVALTVRSQA